MHANPAPRRRHTAELKAAVLAACSEPGASISGVALAHGLNTNLVRNWRSGRGLKRSGLTMEPPREGAAPMCPGAAASLLATQPEFVAIEMPASPKAAARTAVNPSDAAAIAEPLIQVELRRGPLHLNVRWPVSGADDCTAWLRELSSGLVK